MALPKLIRREEVMSLTGYSSSQFDELVLQGVLPQPVKLGPNCRGLLWFEDELEAFLENLRRDRDARLAARKTGATP